MTPIEVFAAQFLDVCVHVSLAVLTISLILTVVRTVKGPTLPDRIVALDMLVAVGIGFIAVFGVLTRYYLYIDVAITLGLVGFLATVAFARFVLNRGLAGDETIMNEIDECVARGKAGK